MSKNLEALQAAHEAWNRRDYATAEKLVAMRTSFVDHGRNVVANDRQTFRAWLESLTEMSSDVRIVEPRYTDAGDCIVAQFRAVGTQAGPIENFPASGKSFTLDACEVWKFNSDGEAIEGHNYSDGLGLLMQLGHLGGPRT